MPEEARGKREESTVVVAEIVVVEKGGGGRSGKRDEDLSANITHIADSEIPSNTV